MMKPRYQDLAPERIPEVTIEDARVRLVAGEAAGVRGPVEGIVTAPTMLDVAIEAKGRFTTSLADGHNALLYVIDGSAESGLRQRGWSRVRSPSSPTAAISWPEPGRRALPALRGAPRGRTGGALRSVRDEHERRAAAGLDDYRSGRLVDGA